VPAHRRGIHNWRPRETAAKACWLVSGAHNSHPWQPRCADFVAKVEDGTHHKLGKDAIPKHLNAGNVIRIWHLCTAFFRAKKDVIN
jgi:hypothetical protein